MDLLSTQTEVIGDELLEGWTPVGSGGFGHVYRARHKDWGFDVAIKLLRDDICPLMKEKVLCEEAGHMQTSSCEFVLRVYGTYRGCPPVRKTSVQQGIVMEFMRRGSIQSLQGDLCGPPPWPLAVRFAHQVALAMNFLHLRNIMHHDLKPSNVLVNDDLNAKLADFGLSRVSTSALTTKEMTEAIGGSYKYMPPEAFQASYEPVRAFDKYSYGILLWSIVTGKEPYPMAEYNRVALRIPLGDRPPCEDMDQMKVDGLKDVVDLMKACWDQRPSERPSFKECLKVTERVLSRHERGVHDAVRDVLERLGSPSGNQDLNMGVRLNLPPQPTEQSESYDSLNNATCQRAGRPSGQVRLLNSDLTRCPVVSSRSEEDCVTNSTVKMKDEDKARFVDDNRAEIIQSVSGVTEVAERLGDMVNRETYSLILAKGTSQDQMRLLYHRTFRSGGATVKAAFYDVLSKHQPKLLERLGG